MKKLLLAFTLLFILLNPVSADVGNPGQDGFPQAPSCTPPFSYDSSKSQCCYGGTCVDPVHMNTGEASGEDVQISLDDKLILRDGTPVKEVFNSTDDIINLIVRVLFVGAGMVLFFIIIAAGFALIKGDSKDKDQAKTQMTGALVGFLIMFAAYWIMQIIQLVTGIGMGF